MSGVLNELSYHKQHSHFGISKLQLESSFSPSAMLLWCLHPGIASFSGSTPPQLSSHHVKKEYYCMIILSFVGGGGPGTGKGDWQVWRSEHYVGID